MEDRSIVWKSQPEEDTMSCILLRSMRIFVLAVVVLVAAAADNAWATDISGCWSGSWLSCKSGHHGPMTATLCKVDDTHYCATFRGRFWKVFPFRYSTTLTVKSDDGETVTLQGSSWLGRLFGTFYYNATVTSTDFNASYSACRDWGKFVMTKCCL